MTLCSWTLLTLAPARAIECQEHEGLWLTSDGETVCRPCPQTTHFSAGRALKLPEGCLTLSQGVHLSLPLYTELRTREEVALRLTIFQDRLDPILDELSLQIQIANTRAANLNDEAIRISRENAQLLEENTSLRTHRKLLIFITSGLVVTTYFALQ